MEVDSYIEESVVRDANVRFRAALSAASAEIRTRLTKAFASWQDVPGLKGTAAALEPLHVSRPRARGRVESGLRIQAFMAERFPGFALQFNGLKIQRYTRPLGPDALLALLWSTKRQFSGGDFLELRVGLRAVDTHGGPDHAELVRSITRYFGRSDLASWPCSTRDDLAGALDGAGAVLSVLTPLLDETVPRYLADPGAAGGSGAVTARQALTLVEGAARKWDAGASLTEAVSSFGFGTDRWGWSVSEDGALRAHGFWSLRFTSPTSRRNACASVPFLGPPEFLPFDEPALGLVVNPVGNDWIDSDAAAQAARSSPTVALSANPLSIRGFELKGAPPRWVVAFATPGDFKSGLNVILDAVTGQSLGLTG